MPFCKASESLSQLRPTRKRMLQTMRMMQRENRRFYPHARNYAETVDESRRGTPSLPAYKLKRVTELMADHMAEDLSLDQLAARVGLSKFHFNRLFKRATRLSPSRYQIELRLNGARRLLRETKKSILNVALEVGYTNPSHFAKLFRRETGLTPVSTANSAD
jgi:AraC family transcriptional regulator